MDKTLVPTEDTLVTKDWYVLRFQQQCGFAMNNCKRTQTWIYEHKYNMDVVDRWWADDFLRVIKALEKVSAALITFDETVKNIKQKAHRTRVEEE